ncbi:helix-turn-helix transcriptional regulator [Thiocapsa rosea]|uniref:DNA-binding CsgD family transcriptional regulator n=1 Tax=Thiocapsa rosea TaxID=69360 RepID=A0A495VD91_9GAMM|nr:helix-turn-helix transcriptional regulator [Thiocapsa rosea]RKT47366.1 DNA-binding CsgD family transcriptional regulator [Thiocapsa rosea]
MKAQTQVLSETIEAIYAAGLNPERWPHALECIGDYFNGEGSIILFYETQSTSTFIYPEKLRSAVNIYLDEQWWKRDLHAQRAIALNMRGFEVMSDQTVASESEIRSHPIYTDFFRRVGFGWLMSCIILPDRHDLVVVSVPRAKAKGPFTSEEMQTLGLLGRHVEQSLRISLRLSNMGSMETALKQALDAIDAGMHTLSADCRILFSNRAGQSQFEDYFYNDDGYLIARVAGEREKLENYLAKAHLAISECKAPKPCVLIGTNGAQLVVWATPVGNDARASFGRWSAPATIVFATPLMRDTQVDPVVLRDCMDLTISEARLASLIGCGMPIEKAAEKLGITVGTARNVLKTVFRKAGVNRQVHLALKIYNLGRISLD